MLKKWERRSEALNSLICFFSLHFTMRTKCKTSILVHKKSCITVYTIIHDIKVIPQITIHLSFIDCIDMCPNGKQCNHFQQINDRQFKLGGLADNAVIFMSYDGRRKAVV